MKTLVKGQVYDVGSLVCVGWNGDHEGYNFRDYFTTSGEYLGPDQYGVEPLFGGARTFVGEKGMMKTQEQIKVAGKSISYDKSGVGHCWVPADSDHCPPSIQEEIAAEIIDGKQAKCSDYVASNGQHYRWN